MGERASAAAAVAAFGRRAARLRSWQIRPVPAWILRAVRFPLRFFLWRESDVGFKEFLASDLIPPRRDLPFVVAPLHFDCVEQVGCSIQRLLRSVIIALTFGAYLVCFWGEVSVFLLSITEIKAELVVGVYCITRMTNDEFVLVICRYLAELLAERHKLSPFIPVLPNSVRLLNQGEPSYTHAICAMIQLN